MKTSDFLEILRQRDALIDVLILSHLKTLGRIYSLESSEGMRIAKGLIVDHFAKDYIVDEKSHNETAMILEMDISSDEKIKLISQIDTRTKKLSSMLSEMAASLRSRTLKDMNEIIYKTKL